MRWGRRRLHQSSGSTTQGNTADRSASGREPFLVHLRAALGPAGVTQLKSALEAAGATLGNYLPHDTYLVFAPRSSVAALHALPGEHRTRV